MSANTEQVLGGMATWSAWIPWEGSRAQAPRQPGVYLLRVQGQVVYVGKAGLRAGRDGQRTPQGLWGRLGRYASGKAATSGFGEAALDRALGERAFLRARWHSLDQVGPQRATEWARAAVAYWKPEVSWTVTETEAGALQLERQVEDALLAAGVALWNRPRGRRAAIHDELS